MAKRKTKRTGEDDTEQQEVVRQNYLLRSGGTISVDDYDENEHKIIEESDDEYMRRMESRPNARPAGPMHPRTTIANLHTYDSTQVPPSPVAPVIPVTTPIPDAKPVMTSDEPNTNLLDPTKRHPDGAMRAPEVTRPEDLDDDDTDDDTDTEDKE